MIIETYKVTTPHLVMKHNALYEEMQYWAHDNCDSFLGINYDKDTAGLWFVWEFGEESDAVFFALKWV